MKFRDGTTPQIRSDEAPRIASASIAPWSSLEQSAGLRAQLLFSEVSAAQREDLRQRTAQAAGGAAPDLSSFVALSLPPGTTTDAVDDVAAQVRTWNDVEVAYVEAAPAPPPVTASDDPRYPNQDYLNAAPEGIDVEAAWAFAGGDGAGIGFVDLEQGWTLNHEDLSGASVTVISGLNQAFAGHGTAVLGVVLGQDNTKGGIGIVPSCSGRVVSEWRDASTFSTPAAIISAAIAMSPGDVLLLEAQRTHGGVFMPVEVEFATYVAILVATALGIIVVEAAGNGSTDLDNHSDPVFGSIFQRGHADFRDSGAIMVGSSNSAAPHARRASSNFGSRIDCYAWGQNIDTADGSTGSTTSYRNNFSGTSGASAIIAGLAVSVQGLAAGRNGQRLEPTSMRSILSARSNGTDSANPSTDKIGVMPSLQSIISQVIYPVGDFPLPSGDTRYAGRPRVVIDAGVYGGVRARAIGQRVAQRLHDRVPVTLLPRTRYGMHERAHDGSVFLALCSDDRLDRTVGSEVWVHGSAAPNSRVLGQRMREALAPQRRSRLVAGPQPALDPTALGMRTAACLVAFDDERDQDMAYEHDMADAMADGVLRYLGVGERGPGANHGEPACCLDDAGPQHEEVRHATSMSTPPELAGLLSYLGVSYATFSPHESDYFLALTALLIAAGTIHAPTLLNRSTFAAEVENFQRSAGLTEDGLPGQDTLWELNRPVALARSLAVTRVAADQIAGSGGYDNFRLRDDIVQRYDAMRAEVLAAGGVISSAGSMRSLSATVTQSRSTKSMHYSGLALDMATDTGMASTNQRYLITEDGSKWRVWCKSDTAPSQTLDAVIWSGGSTSTTSVTVNAFDFTAIAERHGFKRIGPRSGFPGDYMSAEWWHFQCEAALTPWISQFGAELLALSRYDVATLRPHTGIWGNRKKLFKKDWW